MILRISVGALTLNQLYPDCVSELLHEEVSFQKPLFN